MLRGSAFSGFLHVFLLGILLLGIPGFLFLTREPDPVPAVFMDITPLQRETDPLTETPSATARSTLAPMHQDPAVMAPEQSRDSIEPLPDSPSPLADSAELLRPFAGIPGINDAPQPLSSPSDTDAHAGAPQARERAPEASPVPIPAERTTAEQTTAESMDPVTRVADHLAESIPRLQSLRNALREDAPAHESWPGLEPIIERLQLRASEGYAHAQFALAEMLLKGHGLPQDTDGALRLLNRAALGGYLPAQLALGMLHADSPVLDRNLAETHSWWAVSADQGSTHAKEALLAIEPLMGARDSVEAHKRSYQLRSVLVIIHGNNLARASEEQLGERLRIAAALGDVEAIFLLLAHGADANDSDLDGRTALIEAAWRGYPTIVNALIDKGADLGHTDHTGKTPLVWAAINGHEQVATRLIAAGSPIDRVDEDGTSALMRAAWNGHPGVVQTLLNAGARSDLRDKQGRTVLDLARMGGDRNTIALLEGLVGG